MLSLPTLAPQDSYTLWYTTSDSTPPQHAESPSGSAFDHFTAPGPGQNNGGPQPHRRSPGGLHRSPLARLRLDEEYMERRKQNVQNYGHCWIKPPGIPKSLYQLREEKREMEEHQEVLRREALAQELAEAEAEGAEELLMLQGEGGDELEEPRDLDDEVPEADITGLDAEESEPDDDDDDDDDEVDIEEVPRGLLAGRMPEDAYREALVRGEQARTSRFGDDGGSTVGDEEQSQMLQEEDLVHESRLEQHPDLDMDADVNLDDEIPEAEEETGGYEHTDTEAELSSSEDESVDAGVFPPRRYAAAAAASSMVRSDGTQNSMDIGSMLSQSSSQMGSSPRRRSDIRAR